MNTMLTRTFDCRKQRSLRRKTIAFTSSIRRKLHPFTLLLYDYSDTSDPEYLSSNAPPTHVTNICAKFRNAGRVTRR